MPNMSLPQGQLDPDFLDNFKTTDQSRYKSGNEGLRVALGNLTLWMVCEREQ